ncbi:MAG: OmpA family protein [Albidovulum sp.]|nr:OmpA family protein [Albidovulum sp.]
MRIRPELAALLLSITLAEPRYGAAETRSPPWELREISRSRERVDSFRVPVGPFRQGRIEAVREEGIVSRIVFQADGVSSTLTLLNSIWERFESDGFELLFRCEDDECGSFDFRFEYDVADPPGMYVDLGDFRFLSASRESGAETEFLALLVSRSGRRGFVQLDGLGKFARSVNLQRVSTSLQGPETSDAGHSTLARNLLETDRAVLEGLEFKTGSAELGDDANGILNELAMFMKEFPNVSIILVGHTDNSGSMSANVKVSQSRAASVLDRLVARYGIDRSRLSAEGIGFLMPLTANSTEEGRKLNRRVEAVIAAR